MMAIPALEKEESLRLEQVCVLRQQGAGPRRELLSGISFLAASGEISAIVGPSGGGKSTLIRLLNRLEDPTSGAVYLGGTDLRQLDPLQLRRQVALVAQKPFMFQGTVLENLQRSFVYAGKPLLAPDSAELLRALAASRLDEEFLTRDARSLSLGEQQRVSLARALITSPGVLLLDEPTSALDRRSAEELGQAFREISRQQRLCVVLVTHDLALAGRIADHCLFLDGGRILEAGSPAELFTRPRTAQLARFLAGPAPQEV